MGPTIPLNRNIAFSLFRHLGLGVLKDFWTISGEVFGTCLGGSFADVERFLDSFRVGFARINNLYIHVCIYIYIYIERERDR